MKENTDILPATYIKVDKGEYYITDHRKPYECDYIKKTVVWGGDQDEDKLDESAYHSAIDRFHTTFVKIRKPLDRWKKTDGLYNGDGFYFTIVGEYAVMREFKPMEEGI